MAKGVKTGGRKKGTPNKATAQVAAEIAATGETPLEFMLKRMRDEAADPLMRFEAAKAAAPYVHPKLAAIEHTGKDGGPIQTIDVTPEERAKRIAFALAKGLRAAAG
jgi:hypothetical protein